MKKKTIAILLLLAVMFCAFAETKTLNVNLSIEPIFEVKWTKNALAADTVNTTKLGSLDAPDSIGLNSGNGYKSETAIYASWRTNYAQPLTIKISATPFTYDNDEDGATPLHFKIGETDYSSSQPPATFAKEALAKPGPDGSYLRWDSIPVTSIYVDTSEIGMPSSAYGQASVSLTSTLTIEVTVG